MDWMFTVQNDVARLPALAWQQSWMIGGWSFVAAWLGANLVGRWTSNQKAQRAAALFFGVWVLLPGPWGGAYWLGLAFQAPSLTTALLCAVQLMRILHPLAASGHERAAWPPPLVFLALCGVVLGWALLLDTLGLWPNSFYNWGFSVAAPALSLGVVALPWIVGKRLLPNAEIVWLAVATLLFVALRLPSGNLFDALIDPWLWCFLQYALIQQLRRRFKPAFV